jgi:hypothetical protein
VTLCTRNVWTSRHSRKPLCILRHGRQTQFFFHDATALSGPGPPHYRDFTITLRLTTIGGTPLDEWSARSKNLYLTTHNTLKRVTSMPSGGIRTRNCSKGAAVNSRLRLCGHCNLKLLRFGITHLAIKRAVYFSKVININCIRYRIFLKFDENVSLLLLLFYYYHHHHLLLLLLSYYVALYAKSVLGLLSLTYVNHTKTHTR